MSKENMAELKIKVPERLANFLDDIYTTRRLNRDKELREWAESLILAEYEVLDFADRIRLVEKHKVEDRYPIAQWEREAAACGESVKEHERKVRERMRIERAVAFRDALANALAHPETTSKLAEAVET